MLIYIKPDCKVYHGLLEPTEEERELVREGKLVILSVDANSTYLLDKNGKDFNIRGTVFYDKKKSKFTYIQYGDRYNYAVQFSITSRAAFFCRDFYNQIKHIFPFGYSQKKLTAYLTSNFDYIMSTIKTNPDEPICN